MRTLGSVSLNLSMPLIPFFHGFSVPNPPQAYPGHSKVAVVAAAISGRLLEILGDHGLAGSTWNHTKASKREESKREGGLLHDNSREEQVNTNDNNSIVTLHTTPVHHEQDATLSWRQTG